MNTAKPPAAAPTPSYNAPVTTTSPKNDKHTSSEDAGNIYKLPFGDRKLLAIVSFSRQVPIYKSWMAVIKSL
jgi:hypothetical protein